MARRFHASKKKGQTPSSHRCSVLSEASLENFSQVMEVWPSQQKAVVFLGTFWLFFLFGVFLAVCLNPATVHYLARVGRLPLIDSGR